tara:strand:+ start:597 stop:1181 length:585 start_codon:yes stop_codon:yes gene_type:complete
MSSIKDYVKIFDNAIPTKLITYLIRYVNHLDKFKDATIIGDGRGEIVNKKIRDVSNLRLDSWMPQKTGVMFYNKFKQCIINCFLRYQKEVTPYAFGGQMYMEVLKYKKDGHYGWHVDHASNLNRTLSIIIFLNNDYEGGELLIADPRSNEKEKDALVVKPSPGKLIMWPSSFMYPHKVKPVTKGKRFTVVSWIT